METQREENNTDNQQSNQLIQRTNSNRSPPATRASSDVQVVRTAGAGLPRRRIKWTHDMNVSVLRAYYKATRIGSLTGYRQQMYDIFLAEFPELSHLSQQNLADRRAAIMRNNLIPPTIQDEIRQIVENEMNQHNSPNQIQQNQSNSDINTIVPTQIPTHPNSEEIIQDIQTTPPQQTHSPNQQEDNVISKIASIFNEAKIKFMEISSENRPHIHKPQPTKKLHYLTSIVNTQILPRETLQENSYEYIIGLIYCSAYTITQAMKQLGKTSQQNNAQNIETPYPENSLQHQNNKKSKKHRNNIPGWQTRLQKKIEEIRRELGLITNYINGKTGKRSKNKINKIMHKHRIHTRFEPPNQTIDQIRDTIRQKLSKYTQRLRTYTKSYKRSSQNRHFNTNEKSFYSTIANPTTNAHKTTHITNIEEIENYWKSIWNQDIQHNSNPSWMNTVLDTIASNPAMNDHIITEDIFRKSTKKLHNWKQPGYDKIHNYYYKYLTTLHPLIINTFNNMITNPESISQAMCAGITYLKPKTENPTLPSQFRPITCLNSGYKILTSCISMKIGKYCETQKILAEEQKGCRQGTKGCKDQLIIDSVVMNQAIRNKKNLYTAFIDYQKAFDLVPHSWLIEALKIYKIDSKLVNCIEHLMKYWKTTLHLRNGEENIISKPIEILRGIYQGDSLSPLMFCISLNPLSTLLKQSRYGYRLKTAEDNKISHCFYMDDLKLYAGTRPNINHLLQIVEMFSKDIRMQFGIDKCRTQNIVRGKYTPSQNYSTSEGNQITPLLRGEHYKYLGIRQSTTIDHTHQKNITKREFTNRVNAICGTKLNGRNQVKAINTYAISLLTYTFGILTWSTTELNDMDRTIRTIMTKNNYHHPKSSIERFNIPRKQGGRGVLNIKILHDRQIQTLIRYFHTTAETSILYRTIINADNNLTPLNLRNNRPINPITLRDLIQSWKTKALHGKYPNLIDRDHIDMENTTNWLKYSNIYSETEGFIMAIQDGVVNTRNYRKYIIHDNTITDDNCRRCGKAPETIPHLLNSCTALAHSHYTNRHNNMGKIIYINIIKVLKINENTTHYYKYHPKPIIENEDYIIYWDRTILVNNPPEITIPNRPDIVIIEKKARTMRIIDFAVPYDNNIQETINTKKTKYQPLAEYLKNTQKLHKIEIIPIVISSLGTIPKETTRAIEELKLGNTIITEMQKSVLIKATSIIRETLG